MPQEDYPSHQFVGVVLLKHVYYILYLPLLLTISKRKKVKNKLNLTALATLQYTTLRRDKRKFINRIRTNLLFYSFTHRARLSVSA